jgi:hypothetical protein
MEVFARRSTDRTCTTVRLAALEPKKLIGMTGKLAFGFIFLLQLESGAGN